MQVRDSVFCQEEHWEFWVCKDAALFSPEAYGFPKPQGRSTACWRGFRCVYRLREDSLYLETLQITVDESSPPLLNDRAPATWDDELRDNPCGRSSYRDVQLPIDFTGGLLICRRLVTSPTYRNREQAWRFADVRELIFERGKILEYHDRSVEIAKIRDEVTANNGVITLPEPVAKEDAALMRYYSIESKINACCVFDY